MDKNLTLENESRSLNQHSVDILNRAISAKRDLTDEEQKILDRIEQAFVNRKVDSEMVEIYRNVYNATYALNRLRDRINESELIYKSAEVEAELTEIEMVLQYNIQSNLMRALRDLPGICPAIEEKEIKIPKYSLLNYEAE